MRATQGGVHASRKEVCARHARRCARVTQGEVLVSHKVMCASELRCATRAERIGTTQVEAWPSHVFRMLFACVSHAFRTRVVKRSSRLHCTRRLPPHVPSQCAILRCHSLLTTPTQHLPLTTQSSCGTGCRGECGRDRRSPPSRATCQKAMLQQACHNCRLSELTTMSHRGQVRSTKLPNSAATVSHLSVGSNHGCPGRGLPQ